MSAMALPPHITPERWLAQLFGSNLARQGGVVRRSVRDVERLVGRERFRCELDRLGYQAVENAGHFVIFCNREPVRWVRRRPLRARLSNALRSAFG